MTELIIVLTLLVIGFVFGRLAESRHYSNIKVREAATLHQPAVTLDEIMLDRPVRDCGMVSGSICVSVDYYKQFLSGLRMFFGGELRSYSSLIDRARREAILRMREQAPDADAYINVRLETSSVSKGQKDSVGCVEVLAYATAIKYQDEEVRSETPDANG